MHEQNIRTLKECNASDKTDIWSHVLKSNGELVIEGDWKREWESLTSKLKSAHVGL
jgi:hypothetical protein